MFYPGLAAALAFTPLLGLTLLRVLTNRPSPNAEMLCGLMASLEKTTRTAQADPPNAKLVRQDRAPRAADEK